MGPWLRQDVEALFWQLKQVYVDVQYGLNKLKRTGETSKLGISGTKE